MKVLPVRPKHIYYVPRNPEPFFKPGLKFGHEDPQAPFFCDLRDTHVATDACI